MERAISIMSTGDLVTNMRNEKKRGNRPKNSRTFHDRTFLGRVAKSKYPTEVDRTCQAQPTPPQRKAFNTKTMKTKPVKQDRTFYGPREPRPMLT